MKFQRAFAGAAERVLPFFPVRRSAMDTVLGEEEILHRLREDHNAPLVT